MLGGATVVSGYGSFGPVDQLKVWADHALFGKPLPSTDVARGLGFGMLHLDGPMLPAVLQAARAQGWLAEGLARLYAVQESAKDSAATLTAWRSGQRLQLASVW
jgi:hypothetical protein